MGREAIASASASATERDGRGLLLGQIVTFGSSCGEMGMLQWALASWAF
jgi:hypothetical protein